MQCKKCGLEINNIAYNNEFCSRSCKDTYTSTIDAKPSNRSLMIEIKQTDLDNLTQNAQEGVKIGACGDCGGQGADYSTEYEKTLCAACYDERRNRDTQRRQLEGRYKESLQRGDLSKAFRQAGFNRSKPEIEALNPETWKAARNYPMLNASNLYIQGAPGTGKTFMARCILYRHFALYNRSVAEISARRLFKVADTFTEGDGAFERWCTTRLVLLDDIDKVATTDRRLEALWEFFDRRESAELRTIVTANVALDKLAAHLQPKGSANQSLVTATLDRLRPVKVLTMTGQSQRGQQKG